MQVLSFDVLSKVIWGAVSLVLIRSMGKLEYAHYTFALALLGVVVQVVAATFNRIYIIGHQRFELGNSPALFLAVQAMGIAALVAVTQPLRGLAGGLYWLIVLVGFSTCLAEFSKAVFQQRLRFLEASFIELTRSTVLFVGVLIIVYLARQEVKAWQILGIQGAAAAIVFAVAVGRRLDLAGVWKLGDALRVWRVILAGEYRYLFAYFTFLAVFSQADVFFLRVMADSETLAAYGSALRYYGLLSLALGATHTVLLPLLQHARSEAEIDAVFLAQKRVLWLFVPLVAIGGWAAQWIIPWVDNGRYPDAVTVFRILAVLAVISFAFSPHVNLVLRFEDFRFLFSVVAVGALLAVVLNVILIPILGAVGAALATLSAFGVINSGIFLKARAYRRTSAVSSRSPG